MHKSLQITVPEMYLCSNKIKQEPSRRLNTNEVYSIKSFCNRVHIMTHIWWIELWLIKHYAGTNFVSRVAEWELSAYTLRSYLGSPNHYSTLSNYTFLLEIKRKLRCHWTSFKSVLNSLWELLTVSIKYDLISHFTGYCTLVLLDHCCFKYCSVL